MPPLSLLLKPASSLCNMRCTYCFYADEANSRVQGSYGIMRSETLACIFEKAFETAQHSISILFQGGEPSLAGLDFYKTALALERRYNTRGLRINNSIQTNGYRIDRTWAQFFADNHFLVGLSLDGIRQTHDACRRGADGKESFHTVMETARLFDKYKVDYNILTVVNRYTAAQAERIYRFYQKNRLRYLQFIPCLDPLDATEETWLHAEDYGQFLCRLFDLWYADLQKGCQPYIRQFENYVGIFLGRMPESCDMRGVCGIQYAVEADGSVYPCDFYALDAYRLGNLLTDDFSALDRKRAQLKFVETSAQLDTDCRSCSYLPICRGGCRRMRIPGRNGLKNRFCSAYRMFFDHAIKRLTEIAAVISSRTGL